MSTGIGQRLLRAPNQELRLRRIEIDSLALDPEVPVRVHQSGHRRHQGQHVLTQSLHGPAGFGEALANEALRLAHRGSGLVGATGVEQRVGDFELHVDPGQRMRENVVDVACDTGPLGQGMLAQFGVGGAPGIAQCVQTTAS